MIFLASYKMFDVFWDMESKGTGGGVHGFEGRNTLLLISDTCI